MKTAIISFYEIKNKIKNSSTGFNLLLFLILACFTSNSLELRAGCNNPIPFPDYDPYTCDTIVWSLAGNPDVSNHDVSCGAAVLINTEYFLFEAPSEIVDITLLMDDVGVVLYEMGGCNEANEILCLRSTVYFPGIGRSFYAEDLIPGASYILQFWVLNQNINQITFCVEAGSTPLPNDKCSGAIPFPGEIPTYEEGCTPQTIFYLDSSLAKDEGERLPCDDIGNRTQWFSFVAPYSELYFESLQGSPGISVFDSCEDLGDEIVCHNNESGYILGLEPGTTYTMLIWTDLPEPEAQFCLRKAYPSPTNDNCSNFSPFPGTIGEANNCEENEVMLNFAGTTNESVQVPTCSSGNNFSLWYSFIAPADRIAFIPGINNPGIAIFEVGVCGDLNQIACVDNGELGFIDNLEEGLVYRMQVFVSQPNLQNVSFCLEQALECGENESEINIVIKADYRPEDFSYLLYSYPDSVLIDSFALGTLTRDYETQMRSYCLPSNECIKLFAMDELGNGIYCATGNDCGYSVFVNGELNSRIGPRINFGSSQTELFNCEEGFDCSSAQEITPGVYIANSPQYWYAFTPIENGLYEMSTCFSSNTCDNSIGIYENCNFVASQGTITGSLITSSNGCENLEGLASISTLLLQDQTYYIRIGEEGLDCNGEAIEWELQFLGPYPGCNDIYACNYNPLAQIDDGSCIVDDENCSPPDLTVIQSTLTNTIQYTTSSNFDECYLQEGCYTGYGTRRLVRFSTQIENIGGTDYFIGSPPADTEESNDIWEYDPCHGHWHFQSYAEYLLYDNNGNLTPSGFKNGFCLGDFDCSYGGGTPKYSCGNQGLSSGCGDTYDNNTPCQWLDVTDLPAGKYTLVIRINRNEAADFYGREESTYDNNIAQECIRVRRYADGDFRDVIFPANCPEYTDCAGIAFGINELDCTGECGGSAIKGDANHDEILDHSDLHEYEEAILDEATTTSCLDLNADSSFSVIDLVLLAECLHQTEGDHDHEHHDLCEFPYSISNAYDTTKLRIGAVNLDLQYIDIEAQHTFMNISGFQFDMGGITIDSLSLLVETGDTGDVIEFELLHDDNTVIGYWEHSHPIEAQMNYHPLVRVYFNNESAGEEACIEQIIAISNDDREEVVPMITGTCSNRVGNCDGVYDECNICNGTGMSTWYLDADGDGLGSLETSIISCEAPENFVENSEDLNDTCSETLAVLDINCHPQGHSYQLIFALMETQNNDTYVIQNNLTGESINLENFHYTTEAFPSGSPYDYTIFTMANPDCLAEFSSNLVDCITTEIELLEFSGKALANRNHLYWQTASEHESDYFILEKSLNGIDFSELAKIQANGHSNTRQEYQMFDSKIQDASVYYYRLAEVNFSKDKNIVSKVISIERKFEHSSKLILYPIPSHEFLNVQFDFQQDGNVKYAIYNVEGRLIMNDFWKVNKGKNILELDLENLIKGQYFIKMETEENKIISSSFVKM